MLGCHLVPRLLERGWEVVSLVRPGSLSRRPWAAEVLEGSRIIEADLLDASSLRRSLRDLKDLDVVFHLAAVLSARGSRMYRVNYGGTANLLEALEEKISVFVYASSILALGDTLRETASEDAECRPRTSYERSKCDSEKLIMERSRVRGFRAILVRPTWIYGEYTRNPDMPRLVSLAKRGIVPVLISEEHPVSLVYAGDVAEAMVRLVETGSRGIYNVRGPRIYRNGELADALLHAVGREGGLRIKIPKFLLGVAARFMDIIRFILLAPWDIPMDKLARDTGYAPSTELEEGLRRTAKWLLEGRAKS